MEIIERPSRIPWKLSAYGHAGIFVKGSSTVLPLYDLVHNALDSQIGLKETPLNDVVVDWENLYQVNFVFYNTKTNGDAEKHPAFELNMLARDNVTSHQLCDLRPEVKQHFKALFTKLIVIKHNLLVYVTRLLDELDIQKPSSKPKAPDGTLLVDPRISHIKFKWSENHEPIQIANDQWIKIAPSMDSMELLEVAGGGGLVMDISSMLRPVVPNYSKLDIAGRLEIEVHTPPGITLKVPTKPKKSPCYYTSNRGFLFLTPDFEEDEDEEVEEEDD